MTLRYSLYVSPTKVDMLYSQLGSTFFDKMKAGLKLKLGVAEAHIEGETGKALYDKAEAIRTHLSVDFSMWDDRIAKDLYR